MLGLSLALAPSAARAQGVVRLGMVGEFSGPFAQYGQQILGGMKAYMKVNGDTVAGKRRSRVRGTCDDANVNSTNGLKQNF